MAQAQLVPYKIRVSCSFWFLPRVAIPRSSGRTVINYRHRSKIWLTGDKYHIVDAKVTCWHYCHYLLTAVSFWTGERGPKEATPKKEDWRESKLAPERDKLVLCTRCLLQWKAMRGGSCSENINFWGGQGSHWMLSGNGGRSPWAADLQPPAPAQHSLCAMLLLWDYSILYSYWICELSLS